MQDAAAQELLEAALEVTEAHRLGYVSAEATLLGLKAATTPLALDRAHRVNARNSVRARDSGAAEDETVDLPTQLLEFSAFQLESAQKARARAARAAAAALV